MYNDKAYIENMQIAQFTDVDGKYDIPRILPHRIENHTGFIGFNYAITTSRQKAREKAVHFFLDDYQFTRVWNNPKPYVPVLAKFKFVLSPDFSMYTDLPNAISLFNHYRKHWCAAYWQSRGIVVIPSISWADEKSYDYCFDGEPKNATVAVSVTGTQKDEQSRELFLRGYEEMKKRLNPYNVYMFGKKPKDITDTNIIEIPSFINQKFD